MSIRKRHAALMNLLFLLTFSIQLTAQKATRLQTTPDELYEKSVNNPAFQTASKGESFCWNARGAMDQFISNYKLTGETAWLDAGVKYYDFLVGRMDTDPDGYKGWIGPYLSNKNHWQDVLVGDALLLEGMLHFSVLVLEDKKLKAKYGDKANFYVSLAKKNFAEKYDHRGTWIDDGPYGAYIGFNKFLNADNLKEWVTPGPVAEVGMSHPFNKQMDAGLVFLLLHRATGDKVYKDRATKIFLTTKSHFQFFDEHYAWNYWEPLTPGDIDMKKKDTRHGVWVHPWRSGYTAREVGQIVEAYHYGVVFSEEDIKRIINTNLKVMWNKERENPKFISSNGLGKENDTVGLAAFKRTYGHSNVTKNSGELWTALLDFDQTIRDLYELRFKNDKNSEAYLRYKDKVLASPPGFKRKYVNGKVSLPVVHFTESKELYLATALPHILSKGGETILACKSWNAGELQIDLYSRDNRKLSNLYTGNIPKDRTFIYTWNGKTPENNEVRKGEYKIRWTLGSGYREFPLVIK